MSHLLNGNVMFIHEISHSDMKPFKCLRITLNKFTKIWIKMVMCDSVL